MTNPDYRHMIMIVDRSGSMHACKAATEQGINALFSGQAEGTAVGKSDGDGISDSDGISDGNGDGRGNGDGNGDGGGGDGDGGGDGGGGNGDGGGAGNGGSAGGNDGGGWATASLYQFDTEHEVVFAHVPVAEVPAYHLVPRGGTALLDAIGFAFAQEGEWLASLAEHERPGTVIAVIATDGMENASREYKRPQIREIITHQQDVYGWQTLFIGANMDAVQVATSYGIPAQHAMTFRASPAGTASSLSSVRNAMSRGRSGQGYGFTPAERAAALADGD